MTQLAAVATSLETGIQSVPRMGFLRFRALGCVGAAGLALLGAGCPTVDLGDTPTDINLCNPAGGLDYFTAEIYPKFIRPGDTNACTQNGGCHNGSAFQLAAGHGI